MSTLALQPASANTTSAHRNAHNASDVYTSISENNNNIANTASSINFTGLRLLKRFETSAFREMKGKLTVEGSYPAL
jgi:hypothetical protein